MSWWYRHCLRPALFSQESERIHDLTLSALGWTARRPKLSGALGRFFSAAELPVDLWGLRFPNPVGLAAGMDKQARALPVWEKLGFGFCELGGVTWQGQEGNPRPRMFRAPEDEALVNRMGFNNPGASAVAERLADWKARGLWPGHPVGINLGKSKSTPLARASDDYCQSFRALRLLADFFVINVSSPNTPNLRQLQDRAALDEVIGAVQGENVRGPRRPILVKIAPDLTWTAIDEILEIAQARRLDGIVASNTSVARPATGSHRSQKVFGETGGLSGRPLRQRSTEIISHIYRQTRGSLPIIGVGGIFDADDAWAKILAGASLVQVYTGLVFEGPSVAGDIVNGLRQRLRESGHSSLAGAVGTNNPRA